MWYKNHEIDLSSDSRPPRKNGARMDANVRRFPIEDRSAEFGRLSPRGGRPMREAATDYRILTRVVR